MFINQLKSIVSLKNKTLVKDFINKMANAIIYNKLSLSVNKCKFNELIFFLY